VKPRAVVVGLMLVVAGLVACRGSGATEQATTGVTAQPSDTVASPLAATAPLATEPAAAFAATEAALPEAAPLTSTPTPFVYADLPQVAPAIEVRLQAQPWASSSYLPLPALAGGQLVQLVATDADGAWLLVLHQNTLGWFPSLFLSSGTGTLNASLLDGGRRETCASFAGAALGLEAPWESQLAGEVVVEGLMYVPRDVAGGDAISLGLEVSETGERFNLLTGRLPLQNGAELLEFRAKVPDVSVGSHLSFLVDGLQGHTVPFQASFFGPDCSVQLAEVGSGVDSGPNPTPIPTMQVVTIVIRAARPTRLPPPDVAPSGTWRIAFMSDHEVSDAIWTMDGAGAQRQRLTNPPGGLDDWHPEWCNQNQTILFERGDHRKGTENQVVYDVPIGSPGGEFLWPDLPAGLLVTGQPACAHTDPRVYFGGVADYIDWRLYLSDGGQPSIFGQGYEKLGSIAVSRDGAYVAFAYRSVSDSTGTFYLNMASADNPEVAWSIHPTGVGSALALGLSPTAEHIAFACQYGDKKWQLCLADADGTDLNLPGYVIRNVDNKRGQISALAGSPTWSPDGRLVAFASNSDGDWDIYVLAVETGQLTNLTSDWSTNEMMPAWSK